MKPIKIFILVIILVTLSFKAAHKYYLSVTQVEYVEEKKSVQIISRIFMDDMENALKQNYDASLSLDTTNTSVLDAYISKYVTEKIKIEINGEKTDFNFIGKETDLDIMKVYLEIENVENIRSFQITNKVLFELFEEQQNMVKLKMNNLHKSYLLNRQKQHAVLNFD